MTLLWHVSTHGRRGSIQKTTTAEIKNVNAKRKTESDVRIFKDLLSTVGEPRNPENIGVHEMNMHIEDFFQRAQNPNWITNWFIVMYPSFHQQIS
jgi:hypothetical protein